MKHPIYSPSSIRLIFPIIALAALTSTNAQEGVVGDPFSCHDADNKRCIKQTIAAKLTKSAQVKIRKR